MFGYGASAINPYMVNEIIEYQVNNKIIKLTAEKAISNFNIAIAKGIIKVMNKIGISTLHSYRGSQIFEALGLSTKFVDKYFCNTSTRIEGINLHEIQNEINLRHEKAYIYDESNELSLEIGGEYRWRRNGESHSVNPSTISKLQQASKNNDYKSYQVFSKLVNEQNEKLMTLRGMFEFSNFDPIPIEQVEPWTNI